MTDEDAADIAAADRARTDSDVRYPAAVMDAMIAGNTPIAAWRRHRELSQAALAACNHVSRTAIPRLERTAKAPLVRRITRQAITRAHDVPLAAPAPLED